MVVTTLIARVVVCAGGGDHSNSEGGGGHHSNSEGGGV